MSMKDYVDGFIRIKPKWDAEKKAYVDSALFELFIYKHNPYTGEPEVSGTRTIKVPKDKEHPEGKQEVPVNPIAASYTIAISSLTKVLSKEARRCNVYWNRKNRQ